ncbi:MULTISPECIES: hypothetical protein [unclassified Burkholderia]|uniref:hypothetical protein n=1 Tax=unclassified Burkholderia TaxID=2613784 RepID=UPI002AB321AA|nr:MULTISPECIES: hypothetical protein [unclassified Burkholderia]
MTLINGLELSSPGDSTYPVSYFSIQAQRESSCRRIAQPHDLIAHRGGRVIERRVSRTILRGKKHRRGKRCKSQIRRREAQAVMNQQRHGAAAVAFRRQSMQQRDMRCFFPVRQRKPVKRTPRPFAVVAVRHRDQRGKTNAVAGHRKSAHASLHCARNGSRAPLELWQRCDLRSMLLLPTGRRLERSDD